MNMNSSDILFYGQKLITLIMDRHVKKCYPSVYLHAEWFIGEVLILNKFLLITLIPLNSINQIL